MNKKTITFLLLSAMCFSASAQDQTLGMQIRGDDDKEFGLFISNWMQDDKTHLFAPGFTKDEFKERDPWEISLQEKARSALSPASR